MPALRWRRESDRARAARKLTTIPPRAARQEWLDPASPPSAALARCKNCKGMMVLLLQLNGELPDRFPGHERRLYVFACKSKSCRRKDGSIRATRGVRVAPGSISAAAVKKAQKEEKDKEAAAEKAKKVIPNLGETLFGAKTMGSGSGSANPFATGAPPAASNPFSAPANPFSKPGGDAPSKPEAEEPTALPQTFAEKLSLDNPQTPSGPPPPPEAWPEEKDMPSPYPVSYLDDADYETLEPTPPPVSQTTVQMDIDDPAASGAGATDKEDKNVFESAMDADFQKFADRLVQNPDQVIRYEFAGEPLLYSKTDAVGKLLSSGSGNRMPRCGQCGSRRVFEVQLVPNAIAELEAEELGLEGMDWGTIIVGVCEADCQPRGVDEGQAGYVEEWAGVQWEELVTARK